MSRRILMLRNALPVSLAVALAVSVSLNVAAFGSSTIFPDMRANHCAVLNAPDVEKTLHVTDVTVLTKGNTCAFMVGANAIAAVNWSSDPDGSSYARDINASSGPSVTVPGTQAAVMMNKETGLEAHTAKVTFTLIVSLNRPQEQLIGLAAKAASQF